MNKCKTCGWRDRTFCDCPKLRAAHDDNLDISYFDTGGEFNNGDELVYRHETHGDVWHRVGENFGCVHWKANAEQKETCSDCAYFEPGETIGHKDWCEKLECPVEHRSGHCRRWKAKQ